MVGDALVRAPAVVFGPPGIIYDLALGTILGAATVATLLVAGGMGSRPQQEEFSSVEDDDAPFVEEDDRSSVSLGWIFHALMSAKARLGWLLTTAYRSLIASARATARRSRSNVRSLSRRSRRAVLGPAG